MNQQTDSLTHSHGMQRHPNGVHRFGHIRHTHHLPTALLEPDDRTPDGETA